ncbi:heavy-metal-associated domain-containing protein [Chroococcidiopsis sp. FACHB-1243]|uniref:cation transporter n=1 Tax=Chroococcidiopsis sp. [FACHB-1243] TaxID=2692781 RepID=UPI00177CA902|nr:heavy-metal-associated domain-containing protein [Chroococcidiopsis sp. [FACHB-1243]]
MSLQLKVPSIVCEGCAETITKAVKSVDAEAQVDVDVSAKTVKVEGSQSEESIKQAIAATGHTVE